MMVYWQSYQSSATERIVKARAAIKGPKAQTFHVATGVSPGKWTTSEDGRYKKKKKESRRT
jgi:hypothetical protein